MAGHQSQMRGSVCACLQPTCFVICDIRGTWYPKNAKMNACHAYPTSSVLCEAVFANWNFNFMLTLLAACFFQVEDSKSIEISGSQAISIAAIVAFIVLSVQVSFFTYVLCALWDCHSNVTGVVCWFMGLFVYVWGWIILQYLFAVISPKHWRFDIPVIFLKV